MYKPQGKNQQLVGSKDFLCLTGTQQQQQKCSTERERECMRCVCVVDWKGSRAFASRALVLACI